MDEISNLFDPAKDIYRNIEKVITYGVTEESRLRGEITEYIVTDSIEEQLERLLELMQAAMDGGQISDTGVWVSGFYGSGKSSFTKYLGMALDDRYEMDGVPFKKYLQDRLTKPQTRALLSSFTTRYPVAVVMLDLASEMLAGAAMEDVSTVLYYKVLQWAGFSHNLKVAALERRLQQDGRYAEFTDRIKSELGVDWKSVQNDPLVVDSLLPQIAHELYPQLFRSAEAFTTDASAIVTFENQRVQEMIDIARAASGKQHILFIVDEAGQYVASSPHLILNLDGLAKNLKNAGQGKAWIVATAQQTLTEDDPRAALNSPELYKLKDRFPIEIELESSDIREICYRRLLGKSPAGETRLGALFDAHGQALRHHTKLQDARYYNADLDRTAFVNFYPFLPAHFDILLHLLGNLAKSTGGIGLRSAIKVIQDILVEGPNDSDPAAKQPIGWLATTVTLYDALEKDIRRASPAVHQAVEKALIRFPKELTHQEVAKTVAVLQILGNLPVSAQNVASLMHSSVDAPSRRAVVDAAINDLMADSMVPFGEKDGNLCFFSEKVNDIESERAQIPLRAMDVRRLQNEALREVFNPLPSARLHGALSVTAGLRVTSGGQTTALAGDKEPIQLVVELVTTGEYESERDELQRASTQRSAGNTIFLVGRSIPELGDMAREIYRCREIVQRYRNDPDQEVREYCGGQADRADKLAAELVQAYKRCLATGSFVFRGQTTAVESLRPDVADAAQKQLGVVAEQVFDRFDEAPVRADTALAERFLKAGSLSAVTADTDPLGLVRMEGGVPTIVADHKALVSIRDYLERAGSVDGKHLTDVFTTARFGWSPDTLRYLIATMLMASQIQLRVSGRTIAVNGQQAIEALRTNNAFKAVGVSLRDHRPSMDVLARAAERLTDLFGESVIPLEAEISKAAAKMFPNLQFKLGPLPGTLNHLGLPGAELVSAANREVTELLLSDASDAPLRLGGEDSPLYTRLKWAIDVDGALRKGLQETVWQLQELRRGIAELPQSGVPGRLQADTADALAQVGERLAQETFYQHASDLTSTLTEIQSRVRDAVRGLEAEQAKTLHAARQTLQSTPGWSELTSEERANSLARLELADAPATSDLPGLKQLLNREYSMQSNLGELQEGVAKLAAERRQATAPAHYTGTIAVPRRLSSLARLDEVIRSLQDLRSKVAHCQDIDVTVATED